MPTISGTNTTYITRETVWEYAEKAEQMKTISNFARWVLETGAAYVAGIVTKKHPEQIRKAIVGLVSATAFISAAENAMSSNRTEVERAITALAASTDPYAKIKVVTNYSEWQSGSGNHSCNYQVDCTFTIV